jgi:hypothetical protein
MNEQVVLPGWSVAVFVALFVGIVAVARWGVKYLADRIEHDIQALQAEFKASAAATNTAIGSLSNRVTRLETLLETGGGGGGGFPSENTGRHRLPTPSPGG